MTHNIAGRVREFIQKSLQTHNDTNGLDDSESLFLSGRLDSLSVTRLVVYLEENFGVDFGANPFDLDLLDSVELIVAFVEQYGAVEKQDRLSEVRVGG